MMSLNKAATLVDGSEEEKLNVFNNLENLLQSASEKYLLLEANNEVETYEFLKVLYKILLPFSESIQSKWKCKPFIEDLKTTLKKNIESHPVRAVSESQKIWYIKTSCYFLLLDCCGQNCHGELCDVYCQISNCSKTSEKCLIYRIYHFSLCLLTTKVKWISNIFQKEFDKSWSENSISFIVYQQIADIRLQSNQQEAKAVQLLALWLSKLLYARSGKINKATLQIHDCVCSNVLYGRIFSLNSEEPMSPIQIATKNLDHKQKVISNAAMDCIRSLLKLNACCVDSSSTFLKILLKNIKKSMWNTKKVFLQLQVSMEFLHPIEVFGLYPEIPMKLLEGMNSTAVNRHCTNVYKSIFTRLTTDDWLHYFAPVFRNGLNSECAQGLAKNMLKLWLPYTLTKKPELFESIIALICDNSNGLLSKLCIWNLARMQGLFNDRLFDDSYLCREAYTRAVLTILEYESLPGMIFAEHRNNDDYNKGLFHYRNDIRSEAFALLVNTSKPTQPITAYESNTIRMFISANFGIGCSSFRMQFIKCLKILCRRLFSLMASDVQRDIGIRAGDGNRLYSDSELRFTAMGIHFDLLYFLLDEINDSLTLIGSSSRKLIALNCYIEIIKLFYFNSTLPRGEQYIVFTRRYKRENYEKNIISDTILPMLLLHCADEDDNVRRMAAEAISLVFATNPEYHATCDSHWLKKALSMCNSPEPNSSECGGSLLTAVLTTCTDFKQIRNDLSIGLFTTNVSEFIDGADTDIKSFLLMLVNKLQHQFEAASDNILKNSYEAPMHGLIFAICSLLTSPAITVDNDEFTSTYLKKLFLLYKEIVNFVLGCLKPTGFSKECPSFAEVHCALFQQYDKYVAHEYTEEQRIHGTQTILFCCWTCMKACCQSVADITDKFIHIMDKELIRIGIEDIMIHILINTRHKGALEAASQTLTQLSTRIILTKGCIVNEDYLQVQLQKVIQNMDTICESSLTLRAAGLAMIFPSICESSSNLSNYVADVLCNLAEKDVPICLATDCPAVASMHSLRAMLLNSRIVNYLTPFYPRLMDMCLAGFDSGQWVMRNASLQLFGTLITTLVGQKQEKDEISAINSVNFSDFMCRHDDIIRKLTSLLVRHVPSSSEFIAAEVRDDLLNIFAPGAPKPVADSGNKFRNHSSTLPIVSLLSRMTDRSVHSGSLDQLLCALVLCLAHPVCAVRQLSSVCVVKLSNCESGTIANQLLHLVDNRRSTIKANVLHGVLSCVYNAVRFDSPVRDEPDLIDMLYKTGECYQFNPVLSQLYFRICSSIKMMNVSPDWLSAANALTISAGLYKHFGIVPGSSVDILKMGLNCRHYDVIEDILDDICKSRALPPYKEICDTLRDCYDVVSLRSRSVVVEILILYANDHVFELDEKFCGDMQHAFGEPETDDCSLAFVILSTFTLPPKRRSLVTVEKWAAKVNHLGKMDGDQRLKMVAARCLSTALPKLGNSFQFQGMMLVTILNLLHDENDSVRKEVSSGVRSFFQLECDTNTFNCCRGFVVHVMKSALEHEHMEGIDALYDFCNFAIGPQRLVRIYQPDSGHMYGEIVQTGKFISNIPLSFTQTTFTFSEDFKISVLQFVGIKSTKIKDFSVKIPSLEYALLDKNAQLVAALNTNCKIFLLNISQLFL